jgi:ElaB/YqjD/DUF883 family membrane-anchored ribosome-binding protein
MTTNTTTKAATAIARDVQNVVDDAHELLKTVEREGEAKVSQARARLNESIAAARVKFGELGTRAQESAKQVSEKTDEYVHSHPWHAVALGAALGAVVGILVARR